jgi:hypothetical protein
MRIVVRTKNSNENKKRRSNTNKTNEGGSITVEIKSVRSHAIDLIVNVITNHFQNGRTIIGNNHTAHSESSHALIKVAIKEPITDDSNCLLSSSNICFIFSDCFVNVDYKICD